MRYRKLKTSVNPSKTPFSVYLETGILKELRILSAETEIPIQTLMNDAISDLLNKNKNKEEDNK